jgi:Domain of unknown function (DUF4190)
MWATTLPTVMDPISEPAAPHAQTDSAAVVSLVLGLLSLFGLVFPPLIAAAVIAIVLGWTARRRIAAGRHVLKGGRIAIAGMIVGVLGALLSLVLPGFVVSVWIYAAFHGGQLPSGA